MRIACITTSHNRCNYTRTSLKSLKESFYYSKNAKADYYVVDDGSSDGTGDMIRSEYPDVNLLYGDGNLYWNRGIIFGWETAIRSNNHYDAFFIFNDDTLFYKDGLKCIISNLLEASRYNQNCIAITGSLKDPTGGYTTYGGLVKNPKILSPLNFKKVDPNGYLIPCDTFNMNCVLVNKNSVEAIGILDKKYHHSFGDLDYGLRLKKIGGSIFLSTQYVGECARNYKQSTWLDSSMGRLLRLKKMLDVKGLPIRERMYYYRRHSGSLWFLYCMLPYLAVLLWNCEVKYLRD